MRFGISISHGVVGGGSTAVTSWETPPQQYAEGGILRQLPSARCGRGANPGVPDRHAALSFYPEHPIRRSKSTNPKNKKE